MNLQNKQFVFGPFRLDPSNQRLLHDQKPIALAPKAFDTLVYLVENSRCLVSREELMKAVWPDILVEDGNLTVNISLLRKALGDADDGQPYIETVPRKGYRFNAEVKLMPLESADLKRLPAEKEPPFQLAEPGVTRTLEAVARQTAIIAFPQARAWVEEKLPPEPVKAPPEPARKKPPGWALAAAAGLVLVGLVAGWLLWRPRQVTVQLRQRRLTSFAPETAVTAAAISSGGKFIAYANPSGLFIQVIATAETHSLELPEPGFATSSISWFPDSAKLLVDGAGAAKDAPGLWIVPVIGTAKPVKIGSYPPGFLSADGSEIALLGSERAAPQILVMRSDGSGERALFTGGEGETFGNPSWTHDGKRVLFTRYRWNPQLRGNSGSIESCDLATGKPTTIFTGSDFAGDAVSLPGGQILYSKMLGANPAAYGGDLMRIDIDPRTGRASSQPLTIAKWDAPVTGLSLSEDGKHLVLRDLMIRHGVYAGELKDGGKILWSVRRISFGLSREDFPRAWTPDGKTLFIDSDRNGNWEIFKQAFDRAADEPFVEGPEDQFSPRVSPDGLWLLYLERPRNWREPQPVRLMRVPISGGLPEVVLTASEFSEWGLRFECPQRAGMPCLLAQRRDKNLVFRPFDPAKGFQPDAKEIIRHDYDPNNPANWTIAPDGSRFAWIWRDPNEARIRIVSLREDHDGLSGRSEHDVLIPGWSHLHAISWAPDGKGWFVVTRFPANWTLLYVELQGKPHVLMKVTSTYAPDVFPSPDGRHLAFSKQDLGSNVRLLENF
jgi:DNA-binding winged helix-turn-helix (wHTH) protein/Tol biopolymer transport system component